MNMNETGSSHETVENLQFARHSITALVLGLDMMLSC